MGIAAQQQRTDAYMRSHTLSGQVLLDPTSRLHPYPSQSVLVKPAGFGLGRSSPEAVSKVASKHPGMQQDPAGSLLLPSKYRLGLGGSHIQPGSEITSADGCAGVSETLPNATAGLLGEAEQPPSAEAAADGEQNDVDDDDADLSGSEEEESDLMLDSSSHSKSASKSKGSTKGSLAVAKLSKLEADKLQQLKQNHKATVAQPKVRELPAELCTAADQCHQPTSTQQITEGVCG